MNKILKLEPSIKIENARKIVDTRNWIIHAYDNVDNIIIWGVITKYLPKLQIEINNLINKEP